MLGLKTPWLDMEVMPEVPTRVEVILACLGAHCCIGVGNGLAECKRLNGRAMAALDTIQLETNRPGAATKGFAGRTHVDGRVPSADGSARWKALFDTRGGALLAASTLCHDAVGAAGWDRHSS